MNMSVDAVFLSCFARFYKWAGLNKSLAAYALRTSLASCLALALGWWLGFEHPQWAAMSVWTVSQPQQKGMLLEKSLFRLIGTVVGTVVGIVILSVSDGNTLYIALGLTLWLTLCTGAGNLFHGLFSYLTLLSGYTASLVALLKVAQGANIYELGVDRMLTVLVGVIIATLVGVFFTRSSSEEIITVRVRQLTRSVLTLLIQAASAPISAQQIAGLVKEAASIEALLEFHSAGSLRSRRSVRSIRALTYANVALLTRLNAKSSLGELKPVQSYLQCLEFVVENDLGSKFELRCMEKIRLGLGESNLLSAFHNLHTALSEHLRYKEEGKVKTINLRHMVLLHRDWIAAKQAMIRTFVVLGSIAVIWNFTGFTCGALVMLGTSVMITLFSPLEAPASLVKRLILWQCVGLAANLLAKGTFLVNAHSEFQCVLIIMLFILPVIIPLSSTRLNVGAMDYVMIFLLLSHVEYPAHFQIAVDFPFGLAAVGGTVIAYLAFQLIFPTNGCKRSERIKISLISDLKRIYEIKWNEQQAAFIHSRAQHRLLRFVQADSRNTAMTNESLMAAVHLVATIQLVGRVKQMLAMGEFPSAQKNSTQKALADLVNRVLDLNTAGQPLQMDSYKRDYDVLNHLLAESKVC